MRSWPPSLVIGFLAAAACFTKPLRPSELADARDDDGGSSDAMLILAPPCQMWTFGDTFLSPACGAWGIPYMNNGATVSSGSGSLDILPVSAPSNAGCTGNGYIPFDANGFFVEVDSVITAPSGYTGLQLTSDGSGMSASLAVGAEQLKFGDHNVTTEYRSVRYDRLAMRWWRLRPSPDLGGVIADISSDGLEWYQLHEQRGAPPATVKVSLDAGTANYTIADPGFARFRNLGICP